MSLERYPGDLAIIASSEGQPIPADLQARLHWRQDNVDGHTVITLLDDLEPTRRTTVEGEATSNSTRQEQAEGEGGSKRTREKKSTKDDDDQDDQCVVCFSRFGKVQSKKCKMSLSGCVHHLCEQCIDKLASRGDCRCPMCREPFDPMECDYVSDSD